MTLQSAGVGLLASAVQNALEKRVPLYQSGGSADGQTDMKEGRLGSLLGQEGRSHSSVSIVPRVKFQLKVELSRHGVLLCFHSGSDGERSRGTSIFAPVSYLGRDFLPAAKLTVG